ncbi:MAG: hypothetical protein ACRCXT_11045, partial [Paraclostridium sp.]
LISEKFTINVVEKDGYLNLSTVEAFEDDNEEIEEDDSIQLIDEDIEMIELEEEEELDGFDIEDILE